MIDTNIVHNVIICCNLLLRWVSVLLFTVYYYAPPHRVEALSDDARLTSVWRLSLSRIGPKSKTERPRKTKTGTEVAHVTRDSDTTFTVKRVKVKESGHQAALVGCSGQPNMDVQHVTDPYACMMYIVSPLPRGGGILRRPPAELVIIIIIERILLKCR